MKPKIAILQTDGINCDSELLYAFKIAGGRPAAVHINELTTKQKRLSDYQILGLPGGFSYGDDILSGKILANELIHKLGREIDNFVSRNKLIIGICNGFQVLIRMGLLPWKMKPAENVSLMFNDSGHFECRWIRLKIEPSNCVFTQDLEGKIFEMPVAHGEGKFIVENNKTKRRLKKKKHVAARYVDRDGNKISRYPDNPNGSYEAIAAVCNSTGRILGIMPHPERNILLHQQPNFRRKKINTCLPIFKKAIDYFT